MPIDVRCTGCGGLLKLPDELMGKMVRCSACGTTLLAAPPVPVLAYAPAAPAEPAPEPVPTLEESSLPSLEDQIDIPMRLGIVSDSTHHFRGTIAARLTHEGLCLADGRNDFIIRPGECKAVYRRANLIGLEIGDRHIEATVSKMGAYGDRIARDLARLLNGERGPVEVGDYRFEWFVWPLALLPVGVMVLPGGGAYWGALAGGMIGLSLFVAHLDRLPKVTRWGGMVGVGALSYLVFFSALQFFNLPQPWATGIDEKLWKPFSPPGDGYTVELPGKPVKGGVDLHRVYLGFRAHMWTLDLPAQPLHFLTSFSESVEGRGGIEGDLDAVRNDLMNPPITEPREVVHQISETKITVAGYPGREFVIETASRGRLKARAAVVEGRLLVLIVYSNRLSSYDAEVERFFGSIKVDKGRIKPPED
jgi:hypothetical protein